MAILNTDSFYLSFIPIHYIIHREHLVSKYLNMTILWWQFKTIVNYIRSTAKTHQQFKAFIVRNRKRRAYKMIKCTR